MSTVKKVFLGVDAVATGNRIHDLMKRQGLSMKEVAEGVSISQQSVWKWCKGQTVPSLDNMVILSRILGVRMDDIVAVNENIGRTSIPSATQKKGWTVNVGRGEDSKVRNNLGSNMFTLCRASKSMQIQDIAE